MQQSRQCMLKWGRMGEGWISTEGFMIQFAYWCIILPIPTVDLKPIGHNHAETKPGCHQRRQFGILVPSILILCKNPLASLSMFELTLSSSGRITFPPGVTVRRQWQGIDSLWLPWRRKRRVGQKIGKPQKLKRKSWEMRSSQSLC